MLYEKLSKSQQHYLLCLKVYGHDRNTNHKFRTVKALFSKGLIQTHDGTVWGKVSLSQTGFEITPDPSREWIDAQFDEQHKTINQAKKDIAHAYSLIEMAERNLLVLSES